MALEDLGQTALVGWRKPVAERAAGALERKTPLSADQAQAVIGALFFALSVYYVLGTIRRAFAER